MAADAAVFGGDAVVVAEGEADGVGDGGRPVGGEGEGLEGGEPLVDGVPVEFALDLFDHDVAEVGEEGEFGEAAVVEAVVDFGRFGGFAAGGGEEPVPGEAEQGAGGDGGGDAGVGAGDAGGFADEAHGVVGIGEDEVEGDAVGGAVGEGGGFGVFADEAGAEFGVAGARVAEAAAGGLDLAAGEVDADGSAALEEGFGEGDEGAGTAAEVDEAVGGAELEALDDEAGEGVDEGGVRLRAGVGGLVEPALDEGVLHVRFLGRRRAGVACRAWATRDSVIGAGMGADGRW